MNKRFFICILFFVFLLFFISLNKSLAFILPDQSKTFVNDYANILSSVEENILEEKIINFEKENSAEITIVTLLSLDGDVIENVAQEIFTKWGIGKKEKDNGVLVIVSVNDRKTRIHTGYGVEGFLTDLSTSYIQSEIITPAFREGNYFGGLDNSLNKIIEILRGNDVIPQTYSKKSDFKINFEFIFFLILFILQWFVAIFRRSKSWWGGGVFGGILALIIWFFIGLSFIYFLITFIFLVIFGLGFDFLISKKYHEVKDKGGHYPWWIGGSGGSGGGGFGGFGGFGGGRSGGGGSSGSW